MFVKDHDSLQTRHDITQCSCKCNLAFCNSVQWPSWIVSRNCFCEALNELQCRCTVLGCCIQSRLCASASHSTEQKITFWSWVLHLKEGTKSIHTTRHWEDVNRHTRSILLWSEIPSGMCAKLRTVAASNNRVYMPWSLYYYLFVPPICMVLFYTHIPFVVIHTFNAAQPERLQQYWRRNTEAKR